MYSLELVFTVGIGALIVGAIVGAAIAQRSGGTQRTQQQLENQLTELREQAQSYQHEVSEHFTETAQLLNQLTASYRDVHNHLARGAQSLATDGRASETLKKLTADEDSEAGNEAAGNLTPPLDYAPKSTPHGVGVLDEKFGLDDTKREPASVKKA